MDLSEIINSLSPADIAQLRETAGKLFGESVPASQPEKTEASNLPAQLFADPKIIEKMIKVSSMLSENDDQTKFLLALKPLLSEKRREKTDQVIQLQQLLRVLRAISSEEGNGTGSLFSFFSGGK